jgi:hypothetical protein
MEVIAFVVVRYHSGITRARGDVNLIILMAMDLAHTLVVNISDIEVNLEWSGESKAGLKVFEKAVKVFSVGIVGSWLQERC